MLFALLSLSAAALAGDGYQSAKWGMTEAEVRKLVPGLSDQCASFSTSVARCVPVEVLGRKGEASYQFDDAGKLARVRLRFDPATPDFATDVVRTMEAKYGPSTMTKGTGSVTSTWTTEGIVAKFDASAGTPSLVVTYDGKAAAQGAAAKDAL